MAKKILVLNKGKLGEWYTGLRCRRLEVCGRLEFLRVLNDSLPYWFVLVRNFDDAADSPDRKALKEVWPGWLGNSVWRFLEFDKAKSHYDCLSQLPIFVAEQARRVESRAKAAERVRALQTPLPRRPSAFLP
jgi:hypothetical protein